MSSLAMREAYGRKLAAYGEINQRVVVLDADTSSSTLSNFFAQKFPDRFFNIGIAEPCTVDVAAGLALGGKIPVVNVFAALLTLRALEQIRTCVCYARTNVKLSGSYAGVSDFKDGPTHHAIEDIAVMRVLPEMVVIVPADEVEIAAWLPKIIEYEGPVYLRISRAATIKVFGEEPAVEFGKGVLLREGKDAAIIAAGAMVGRSIEAARQLAEDGIQCQVINMSCIKPIDQTLILQTAQQTGAIVTAEEHSIIGGLGGAVAEVLAETIPVPMKRVGIQDKFTGTAYDPETLMDACGLGVVDIVNAVKDVMQRKAE